MLKEMFQDCVKVLRLPTIGTMILVGLLFTYGFTIMHAVFILFTEMAPLEGGSVFLRLKMDAFLLLSD